MSRSSKAGMFGGVAGLAAVVVAGASAARGAARRKRDDHHKGEKFDLLDSDRGSSVAADDGVQLAVREVGPPDAPLTVIFAHGFCLRMGSWHFQRSQLAAIWGDQIRMVFFDHRGHGQSGEAPADSCTIEQLGHDLDAVIRAVVPEGPIVLVGHSMGGMTTLAYVKQRPQMIHARIVGLALIATAAGGLSESGITQALANPALDAFRAVVRRAPNAVQHGRNATSRLVSPIMRAASFGDHRATSPTVVRFSEEMNNSTSLSTLVNFLQALENYEAWDAMGHLQDVPVLILCGDADLITRFRNTIDLAAKLPHAELLRVPGAGHMVQLEQSTVVSEAIDRLVAKVQERSAQTIEAERAWAEQRRVEENGHSPERRGESQERVWAGVRRAFAHRRGDRRLWSAIGGRARRG